MLNENRKNRYLDKLSLVDNRLSYCMKELKRIKKENDPLDNKSLFALWYAFQTATQSLLDLIAMICVDEGIKTTIDRVNIEILADEGIILEKLIQPLLEARALRNVLVHDYNGIDITRALESIKRLLPSLYQMVELISRWLKKK